MMTSTTQDTTVYGSVEAGGTKQHYNDERPHSALGYQTPSGFKCAWVAAQEKSDDPNIAT
jgi:hypothetical protein